MITPTTLFGIAAYGGSIAVVAVLFVTRGSQNRVEYDGFVLMLGAVWLWLVAYGTALIGGSIVDPLAAYNFVLLAASVGAVGVFQFVLAYTRQYTLSRRALTALLVIPVVTQVAAWTNPVHFLIWDPAITVLAGGGVSRVYGPLFYVPHAAFAYSLTFMSLGLLASHTLQTHGIYQKRAGLLLVSGLFVPVSDLVNVFGSPLGPQFDLTPLAFFQFTLVVGWVVFRYRFLDLAPIARRQAIENMNDGVLVLDDEQRILDSNAPGRAFLGHETDPTGHRIEGHRPELAAAIRRISDNSAANSVDQTVTVGSLTEAVYDLNISPLSVGPEQFGHIVVIRDVSERERRIDELQRQNDRLDTFTGVVSHDLRNPLNVVSGYFELAQSDIPAEYREPIDRNIRRMDRMITDLLTMATAGQTVTDPNDVSLAATAQQAWGHIDTTGVEFALEIPDDVVLSADHDRLLHVFENLFRNAIDHNELPLTIRVGTVDQAAQQTDSVQSIGFFIEDSGQGIRTADHERIFEHGYTTDRNGTGLGLAIVKEITDAHGWQIHSTSRASGGARFDILTGR